MFYIALSPPFRYNRVGGCWDITCFSYFVYTLLSSNLHLQIRCNNLNKQLILLLRGKNRCEKIFRAIDLFLEGQNWFLSKEIWTRGRTT
jgi:hypothetical protein